MFTRSLILLKSRQSDLKTPDLLVSTISKRSKWTKTKPFIDNQYDFYIGPYLLCFAIGAFTTYRVYRKF